MALGALLWRCHRLDPANLIRLPAEFVGEVAAAIDDRRSAGPGAPPASGNIRLAHHEPTRPEEFRDMVNLLIGNCYTEETAGDPTRLPPAYHPAVAASSQLVLWFAEDHDVLVLPVRPDDELLDYVTGLTGTDRATLNVVVPPAGIAGAELLTSDRLADPRFRDELSAALGRRLVGEVLALTPDAAVAALGTALGFADAVPGHAFLSQGGGMFVNSKSGFRMAAAGAGVPIPAGGVATTRTDAGELIATLFADGYPLILKRDFSGGGMGNEIVSPVPGVRAVGARRVVELTDRDSIDAYLDDGWEWLTNGGRFPVVIERYLPDSRGLFAEFVVRDQGPVYSEQGEMLYTPFASSQIIPVLDIPQRVLAELVSGGTRLCQALHALGYRGEVSADAIVTPAGEVLYTEWNGRVTGTTHLYRVVGRRIVGPAFGITRMLVEHCDWVVPSFATAVERLESSGLAYDPAAQRGVVLVKAYSHGDSTVRYCVIAEDREAASHIHKRVEDLFASRST